MCDDLSLEVFQLNVVKFIENVEQHPAVWDRTYNATCTNKVLLEERAAAWKLICRKYDADFDNKTLRDQRQTEKFLKSKWRNLRDCYLRELRDMIRHSKNEHGYNKKRKRPYIYFRNLRFIGDLTTDEQTKVKQTLEENGDFYEDDTLADHYSNEEDILQTLISEGGPEIEGEHIVIEQVSTLSRQRKRSLPPETHETQDNPSTKRRIIPGTINTSQFDESSEEQTEEHFLCVDSAYPMTRPPDIDRVVKELPMDSRSLSSCEIDEDRFFMLSMVPDMKLVPKHMKLDMKVDILKVVRDYVKKSRSEETNN